VSEPYPLMRTALDRLDQDALLYVTAAVSVRADAVRAKLDRHRLAWVGRPGPAPEAWELDRTAEVVIGWSRANVGIAGGITGLGGLLGVPPELAAVAVATLRLAQRLAVVHGLDPATDRGRVAVARALAAAWQVELPPGGVERMTLREVVQSAARAAPSVQGLPSQLATAAAFGATLRLFGRFGRVVPLLSSAVAAVEGQRRIELSGRLMHRALGRMTGTNSGQADVEDAVEVPVDAPPSR
jgi:hypothetical protein